MPSAAANRRFTVFAILVFALLASAAHAVAEELRGTVVAADGSPIRAASVILRSGDQRVATRSDDEGRFVIELPTAVERGRMTLELNATGYLSASVPVSGGAGDLRIELATRSVFSAEVQVAGTRASAGSTPVTVSNIGREEIERGSWGQDVPMFLAQVPGFYAYSDSGNGIGYSYFTLRGFDMTRTAVSLNGVPLNDAHSHAVFFIDLADFLGTTGDIQVQRGVGTSLYGGSAIGGSVDLRTRTPLTARRLRVSSSHGSWGTHKWGFEYDSGLMDNSWAATFRWSKISTDGYRDQSWVDMWNYYGAVEHYGDRSTTRFVFFGGPEDTHLAYEGIPKPYLDGEISGDRRRDRRFNPLQYENEIDTFFQPHFQLHHDVQLSPSTILRNAFYTFEGDGYYEQYKGDAWLPEYGIEPFPGGDGELVDTTDLVRRREVDEWDFGWIPQLEWSHGDGRGVLQAGIATRLHSGHHFGYVTWAQANPPDLAPNHRYYDYRLDKLTLQPFVQESWRVNPQWQLLAGLSWSSHDYQMKDDRLDDVEVDESFSYLLPRVGVSYQPTGRWSLFANVSRGGREPAFRNIYDPQDYWFGDHALDLEPEDLLDYEIGARHTWASGYASLNFFWLDFDNAIVYAGGLDNNGVPVTANGAVVDQHGVELDAAWMATERWGGKLAVAYNRATYDEFVEYGWDGSELDHAGNRLPYTPEWLATLQVSGGLGPVDGLLILRHVDDFFIDNTEDLRKYPEERAVDGYVHRVNSSFTVVDLSLEIDLGQTAASLVDASSLRLQLRVNNLLDDLHTTFGYVWPEPVWVPAATRSVYGGITVDW